MDVFQSINWMTFVTFSHIFGLMLIEFNLYEYHEHTSFSMFNSISRFHVCIVVSLLTITACWFFRCKRERFVMYHEIHVTLARVNFIIAFIIFIVKFALIWLGEEPLPFACDPSRENSNTNNVYHFILAGVVMNFVCSFWWVAYTTTTIKKKEP